MSTELIDCPPCCGVGTECCSNDLPEILTATITHNSDVTGDCSIWNGATGTLKFEVASGRWIGVVNPGCGEVMNLEFYCIEGGVDCEDLRLDWEIRAICTTPDGADGVTPDLPCECDPLDVDFGIGFDAACVCCTSGTTSLTVTITE